jgi:hypothetical protein
MRGTSILAYKSLTKEHLGERQQEVLECIEENFPCSDKQIADYLGLPINCITPRRGELEKKKLIVQAFVGVNSLGRRAIYWKPAKVSDELADVR